MTNPSSDMAKRPQAADANPDPVVQLRLSEIQWIRDRLRAVSGESNRVGRLWSQVADLYRRLAQQATKP
jgi:hypothetical protein